MCNNMEMPVPCDKCGEWVGLNSVRQAESDRNKLFCDKCYEIDSEVDMLFQQILDYEHELDNDTENVKGRRREYRKYIKENENRIKELGYSLDELR